MPIATPEVYAAMLDRAKEQRFAYPAINCSSSIAVVAAIRGFAEAESDGIVQVSSGGAQFASGMGVRDMVVGATALAEFATVVASAYPVHVALHTDHCAPDLLGSFMEPLLRQSVERVREGRLPLFQSHMWDGSAIPLSANLATAERLLELSVAARAILEIEIGVVGGQEDGVTVAHEESVYSTVEDGLATAEALGLGERGRYLVAATFGNVHGLYRPGDVVLRPAVLREIQDAVGSQHARPRPFDLVFHGGSGSLLTEIHESLDYGVVKMNIDTDTQYAFTRPIADHMFRHYDGVLKVDGGVGNKKVFDPRSYGEAAESGMAGRVTQACMDLRSAGTTMGAMA